jgi:hypothetical protein
MNCCGLLGEKIRAILVRIFFVFTQNILFYTNPQFWHDFIFCVLPFLNITITICLRILYKGIAHSKNFACVFYTKAPSKFG